MSRSVSIRFSFRGAQPPAVSSVLQALEHYGWGLVEPMGVSYALEDADGDLDWRAAHPSALGEIVPLVSDPARTQQHVGVCVYHQGAQTGGHLIFFPGREDVSFLPDVNRLPHPIGEEFTNIPWYLENMLPALHQTGLMGYLAEDAAD